MPRKIIIKIWDDVDPATALGCVVGIQHRMIPGWKEVIFDDKRHSILCTKTKAGTEVFQVSKSTRIN